MAVGDVDNDGALDLLVTQAAGPARLFRNVAPKTSHWLMVRALDRSGRRDAVGAEIQVEVAGRQRSQLVQPGSSYLCSNDPRVHFGLGVAQQVGGVRVTWPDGMVEMFAGGHVVTFRRANQRLKDGYQRAIGIWVF